MSGPYGEAIEMQVPGRIGSHCFPTARFQLGDSPISRKASLGISRFIFTEGELVEFALVLNAPLGVSEAEGKAVSERVMDGFWLGLKGI